MAAADRTGIFRVGARSMEAFFAYIRNHLKMEYGIYLQNKILVSNF